MDKNEGSDQSVSERIINEFKYLMNMFPDSMQFLGKQIYYPQPKKTLFKAKKLPDLSDLREEIKKFSEREGVTQARETISKKLKQFPYMADLRALKAIQVFNDLSQSGISQNKMDALYDPLVMITKALYNGGSSIFNANWFMTIYLKYLEIIRERLSREYNFGIHYADSEVRKSAERLYLKLLKVPRLIQVRNNLTSLTQLSLKLKGSAFVTESITPQELKLACQAIAGKNETKVITSGKTANSIVFVNFVLNSLYSRIPILREMVNRNMKNIPDINRDLILQKQMIINNARVNDFQLALATGNKDMAKEIAERIYSQSVRNVNFYLENAILAQQFEVDPFLKTAWISKESRELFESRVNKERFEQSSAFLDVIMSTRCQHKASLEIASNYLAEIKHLLTESGS